MKAFEVEVRVLSLLLPHLLDFSHDAINRFPFVKGFPFLGIISMPSRKLTDKAQGIGDAKFTAEYRDGSMIDFVQ
jgi:hypothetical protein